MFLLLSYYPLSTTTHTGRFSFVAYNSSIVNRMTADINCQKGSRREIERGSVCASGSPPSLLCLPTFFFFGVTYVVMKKKFQ